MPYERIVGSGGRSSNIMMKHIIVGTAGHIDHGKTALIHALTGTNTDRLKEEQQRGITIDIGFAFLALSQDIELGIVDVPGHEKFVKNMLAGIGGIDLAILVIAADEGIMPQTEEHLAICDLLQIRHGLVALTKTDLVDDEWREMVIEDVREGLAGSFLQDAPILPVSSKTGAGLPELRQELETLAAQVQARGTEGIFRLPIDRVFTIKGFGTVVTGTMIAGEVGPDDVLEILPNKIRTKVRNVQVHDAPVEKAYAGQRTALNLQGLEKRLVQRGDVLAQPDLLSSTYMIDASLTLTPKAPRTLKYRARVRFHHGTSEILARVIFFDREELLPGESAFVQFRLESPLVALARDRYIIRSYSPVLTIGGGEILYTHPRKHKRSPQILDRMQTLKDGSLEEVLAIYVEDAGLQPITPNAISGKIAVPEARIEEGAQRLIQETRIINTSPQGIAVIHASHYQQATAHLLGLIEEFHAQYPLKPGIAKEELRKKMPAELPSLVFQQILDEQVAEGKVVVEQKTVKKSDYRLELTSRQQQILRALEALYLSAQYQPPTRKEAVAKTGFPEKESQEILQVLLENGTLVKIDGELYYHKDILQGMVQRVIAYLKEHHEMTVGEVKDLFQCSRKYTVPFLAYLDATGITMRTGDVRILRS